MIFVVGISEIGNCSCLEISVNESLISEVGLEISKSQFLIFLIAFQISVINY